MTMEDNVKIIKPFSQSERELDQESINKKIEQRRIAAKNNQNNTNPEINLNISIFNRCSNLRLSPLKIQIDNDGKDITHKP